MATTNDPDIFTVAPGVVRHNCCWGYYLMGRKEAIIAAGLVSESWFADGTQRNKRGQVVRLKEMSVDGRRIRTTISAKGHGEVNVFYTEAELAANENTTQEKALSSWSDLGPDEYRAELLTLANVMFGALVRYAGGLGVVSKLRCHLSSPDVERLRHQLDEAISIIENAAIRERRAPDQENAPARALLTKAESDPHFQRFIGKLDLGQQPG